jgi:hypothetical protein
MTQAVECLLSKHQALSSNLILERKEGRTIKPVEIVLRKAEDGE